MFRRGMFLLVFSGLLVSCVSDKQLEKKVSDIIKKNPKIIIDAIKENPADFVMAFQDAVQSAKADMAKKREEEEKKKLEEAFNNPLKPEIRTDESFRGPKGAPITLVEYSDFECPFCSRGFNTVRELMDKYGDKIRFVFKHLPLSFHKNAMAASQYYEALRLQNPELAFKFHDAVFDNQRKLKNGESFLKKIAKDIGADMTKLASDLKNPKVDERIKQDMAEAAKFGMQGTPGFLINGIPVKGAYPTSHFVDILKKLKEKGKLSIDL